MRKGKILVVEAEKVIVKCIKAILTQEGHNVSGIVASGEEAVEIALKTMPDLILMDIKLKGKIDGITAYEQIRKSANIPAIFISTCENQETIERAMATGAIAYLIKPFRNSGLKEEVKAALSSVANPGAADILA